MLARNVAAIRRPPAAQATEIEILTPDQITAVLDALKGHTLHPIASLALLPDCAAASCSPCNGATSISTLACFASSTPSRRRKPAFGSKRPRRNEAGAISPCRKRRSPCSELTRSGKWRSGSR